ncbi:MAG: aldo/keto reductase [Gammaproteobacteria bacterium]
MTSHHEESARGTGPDRGRRRLMQAAGGLLALPFVPRARAADGPLTRQIPSSGESIPVIGMGTWITFNVGDDPAAIARRTDVLRTFLELGGGMVDSSPMYGSAEATLGACLDAIGRGSELQSRLFAATKVWTWSADEGRAQIADSRRLWGVERFGLQQVHNLAAWEDHLPHLQTLKARAELGYVGITTSHGRRHAELERIMAREAIDFVQLTYNILDREAEQRLLPLARERGIAVIANRPFRRGALIDALRNKPLPSWVEETGARTWPQFLLRFVVSHPALTCAIPATSRVDHMRENMAAGHGVLPDEPLRQRMARYVQSL